MNRFIDDQYQVINRGASGAERRELLSPGERELRDLPLLAASECNGSRYNEWKDADTQ